jgi:teichuronic acid biosynthesis protein TuaE
MDAPGVFLCSVIVGLYLIAMISGHRKFFYDKQALLILGFFLFWLCWGLLSIIWALNQQVVISYSFYNMIFLTLALLFSQETISHHFFGFVRTFLTLEVLILIAVALWEIMTWNHLPNSRFVKKDITTFKPTAVFTNENDLASALLLYYPIALYYLRNAKQVIIKILMIAIMVVSAAIVIVNGARLAMLIMAVVLSLYWIFFSSKKVKIATVVIVLLLFIFLLNFYQTYVNIAIEFIQLQMESFSSEAASVYTSPTAIRVELIKKAIDMLFKSHLIGVGSGNFDYYMNPVETIDTGGVIKNHNLTLEIMSNNGLILAVYFTVLLFISGWKYLYTAVHNRSYMAFHYLMVLFVFVFCSVIPSSIMGYHIFWIGLMYILFGYREIKQRSIDELSSD